jgi:hypothetical protein
MVRGGKSAACAAKTQSTVLAAKPMPPTKAREFMTDLQPL